ncbi:hypothetical protein HYPSUDRAFT_32792 [Hypholoma sublateritium FD-334 SS-4]|uniref:Uncharacterized protein n=1 Tax=Hypholoma sublateritium (strain FD-334 SS-4) TaxID=945553 RepID=A0A0D2PF41_HYPSF|nr:hypothetical protein HYPSUDRAFT_32792 [Hypholoma sublateritium FD-334 SS-4]
MASSSADWLVPGSRSALNSHVLVGIISSQDSVPMDKEERPHMCVRYFLVTRGQGRTPRKLYGTRTKDNNSSGNLLLTLSWAHEGNMFSGRWKNRCQSFIPARQSVSTIFIRMYDVVLNERDCYFAMNCDALALFLEVQNCPHRMTEVIYSTSRAARELLQVTPAASQQQRFRQPILCRRYFYINILRDPEMPISPDL